MYVWSIFILKVILIIVKVVNIYLNLVVCIVWNNIYVVINNVNISILLILFVWFIVGIIGVKVIVRVVNFLVYILNVCFMSMYSKRIELMFVNVCGRMMFYLWNLNILVLIVWI